MATLNFVKDGNRHVAVTKAEGAFALKIKHRKKGKVTIGISSVQPADVNDASEYALLDTNWNCSEGAWDRCFGREGYPVWIRISTTGDPEKGEITVYS